MGIEGRWPPEITARASFIDQAQLDVGLLKLFDDFVQGIERAADEAVVAHLRIAARRDGNGFLVDVQTDVTHSFVHGCLVSLRYQ